MLHAGTAKPGAENRPSPAGTVCPCLSFPLSPLILAHAFRGRGGPEHPDSGFKERSSTTELVQRAEENALPGIPTQQAID
jgi:hypothetical protein